MVEWSAPRLGDREVQGSNPAASFFCSFNFAERKSIALSQNGWMDARA